METHPSIPIQDHDDDAHAHPAMSAILSYWCALNEGNPPKRSVFEFMDVYQYAPHLLMSERVAPCTFSFIYCGTHVADNFPRDLTAKTYGPNSVEASHIPWFDYKSIAIDTPCIRFGRDRLDWPNTKYDTILSGIFPLTDDDGANRYPLACLVFLNSSAES